MANPTNSPRPSMAEACKAKCFDCTANFADGRRNCEINDCPLYLRMPYKRGARPNFRWIFGKWNRGLLVKAAELGLENEPRKFVRKIYYRDGKVRIPMSQLFRAKCFRCCGDYWQPGTEKGRVECEITSCPLYFWTPYRELAPSYEWMFNFDHTKKHRLAIAALGLTQEEYVDRLLVQKDL